MDHIMPRCLGGSNKPHNLVLSCPVCNLKKMGKPPWVWRASIALPIAIHSDFVDRMILESRYHRNMYQLERALIAFSFNDLVNGHYKYPILEDGESGDL